MGKSRIRSLKARVGRESCISIGEPDGPGSTMKVCRLEVNSVGRSGISRRGRDAAGRATPGVIAS